MGSFGWDWLNDAVNQLEIDPITRVVPYGQLPDLSCCRFWQRCFIYLEWNYVRGKGA